MVTEIQLSLHPLEPIFGEWCDVCLLPSAVLVPVLIKQDGERVGTTSVRFCSDCEQ